MRFLVDRFGEEFKYEDPRISDDYIDRNNIHGQYEIVLDDDGESPAVIAIWENEENEMRTRFSENKKIFKEGAKGKNELTEDAILDAIPVDARDGLIDINKPDGSFGRYTWYVKFAPFSDEEAKEAANGIKEVTGRRTQVAGFGREIYVLIMDYPSRPTSESRKLVKEGAGAGYTVEIKGLKFGKILSKKIVPDEYYGYYECQVEILPGEYEIAAEDYYNDFFWQEHEFGETPTARIDGGVATVVYSKQWKDDEQAEDDLAENVENKKLDISFDYGHGWSHADLPREKIDADHVDVENDGYYAGIDKIELNAPDLADAVNSGHASIFDRDEEEDDEDDIMTESDAWGRRKPQKSKDVIVKVDVEWAGMDSEDEDEQYLDDVGLPGSVYINIPWESYADGELDYDLMTKLGNTFDGYVEDYTYHRVEPRAVPKGFPIYLWSPDTDIMEEF